MPTPMKDVVSAAYKEAVKAGREAKLYVTSPDKVRIVGVTTDHTYEHAGAAAELGKLLPTMKAAGEWDDFHGRWAYNLRHGANVEIGRGARAPKVAPVVAPEPEPEPEPVKELNEREKLTVLLNKRSELEAAMTALSIAIGLQTKLADTEQAAEDDAAEAELAAQEKELAARLAAIQARKAARTPVEAPKAAPVAKK